MEDKCYCTGEQKCTPCIIKKRKIEYVKTHPNATMEDFDEEGKNPKWLWPAMIIILATEIYLIYKLIVGKL